MTRSHYDLATGSSVGISVSGIVEAEEAILRGRHVGVDCVRREVVRIRCYDWGIDIDVTEG